MEYITALLIGYFGFWIFIAIGGLGKRIESRRYWKEHHAKIDGYITSVFNDIGMLYINIRALKVNMLVIKEKAFSLFYANVPYGYFEPVVSKINIINPYQLRTSNIVHISFEVTYGMKDSDPTYKTYCATIPLTVQEFFEWILPSK